MDKNSEILNKIGRKSGMTVPDGYFADFASRMAQSLPPLKKAEEPAKRSLWLRVRPYTYLAAMFCGIWLMMQMFGMMSSSHIDLNNYPEFQNALANENVVKDYFCPSTDEYYMLEDLYDSGLDPDELFDEASDSTLTVEPEALPDDQDPLYSPITNE